MTEEEAIFTLGKRFSELRNQGDDLPNERVKVGNSMVLPEELADEYDRHFPPGPPRFKQATDRKFQYELVPLYEFAMSAWCQGVLIKHNEIEFPVLKEFEVFKSISTYELKKRIKTTRCNRYDILTGHSYKFAIDKVDESISVLYAKFRVDNITFCEEAPIAGNDTVAFCDSDANSIGSTYFPFIPFEQFSVVWEGYVSFRKSQISELRNT